MIATLEPAPKGKTIMDPVDPIAEARGLHRQAADNFITLAKRTAKGEAITAAEITAAAQAAGKTIDEFSTLVNAMGRRDEMRRQIAAGREAERRAEELQIQLTAANNQLDAAVTRATNEHQRTAMPIQTELREARQRISMALTLPGELIRTCPDRSLLAHLQQLSRQRESVANHIHQLRHRRGTLPQNDELKLAALQAQEADLTANIETLTRKIMEY
jgi:predicted  nucleic acid-binding Zn-ribbon protein